MSDNTTNFETQIALLNREVAAHDTIIKTLTGVIHEMGKVNNSIERMLVVNDQRMLSTDRQLIEVRREFQEHQEEMHEEIGKLYDHIEEKNEKLAGMITSSESRISQSIEHLSTTIGEREKMITERIERLEKKWYLILGGGAVLLIVLKVLGVDLTSLLGVIIP